MYGPAFRGHSRPVVLHLGFATVFACSAMLAGRYVDRDGFVGRGLAGR